jgi:DNA-binding MarR family transcriptional regulator
MPRSNPQHSFGFLLHDISRLLRKRFDRRARDLGLTRAQWSVLAHLSRHEGINQTALAEILEIEPISLVRLLDRLEAAGWVERRLDAADRRVRLLFLTPKAHPVLGRMQELGAETRAEAMAGLSATRQAALIEMLLAVKENLCAREAASQTDEAGSDRPALRRGSRP